MMTRTVSIENEWQTTEMTAMACGACGIPWMVPTVFYRERKKTGEGFFCPNGHSRVFRKTTEEELRERITRIEGERDRAERGRQYQMEEKQTAKRQAAAQKGLRTRQRNQILRGLCPQCGHMFKGVRRHMQRKHPSLLKELQR